MAPNSGARGIELASGAGARRRVYGPPAYHLVSELARQDGLQVWEAYL